MAPDDALSVFLRLATQLSSDSSPNEWARATFNLGRLQREKGEQERDNRLIEESIETFSKCLGIYSIDSHPVQWAATHFELAKSHLALAEVGCVDHINHCREECHHALAIFESKPGNKLVTQIGEIVERLDELEDDQLVTHSK